MTHAYLTDEERETVDLARRYEKAREPMATSRLLAIIDRLSTAAEKPPQDAPDEVVADVMEEYAIWYASLNHPDKVWGVGAHRKELLTATTYAETFFHLLKQRPLVTRERLAKWFQGSVYGENWNSVLEEWEPPSDKVAGEFADALLSADLGFKVVSYEDAYAAIYRELENLTMRDEVKEWGAVHRADLPCVVSHAARAILRLIADGSAK